MLAGVAPPVSRPVNVALVIEVGPVRTKSSADSISNLPALSGRDAVAIFPSGSPVLKKNGVAVTGAVKKRKARTATKKEMARVMFIPPVPSVAAYGMSRDVTVALSRPRTVGGPMVSDRRSVGEQAYDIVIVGVVIDSRKPDRIGGARVREERERPTGGKQDKHEATPPTEVSSGGITPLDKTREILPSYPSTHAASRRAEQSRTYGNRLPGSSRRILRTCR